MPFPRFVGPISTRHLGHNERRIDEAFFFIQRAVFTKLVGNVRQNQTQNLVAAPSLKASMHSFVVRIALRQHVPLRTCVKSTEPLPAHDESESACVQHAHREYAPPENASECAPTVRPSAKSFLIYSGSTAIGNFEIGSSKKPQALWRPRRDDRRHSGSLLVPLSAHKSGFHANDLDGVRKAVACPPPKQT